MCNKQSSGFTLVEMIIAIVIISVGLAGVLLAFNSTVKSSADPLIHKQMLAVAEEMLEEVLLKPYLAAPGTISGCNRASADDVSDYAVYTDQPVCDIDGTAVSGLNGYTVSVAVDASASLGSPSPPVGSVKKVTVVVTHGSETLSLIGWRTNYAAP